MMRNVWLLLILGILTVPISARATDYPLFARGPSQARGVLVNLTVGAADRRAIDPSRPTVVVVHGINPFHPFYHYTVAERYAEVLGRRFGAGFNVLGWDWNADTMPNIIPRIVDKHAIGKGQALATAIQQAGINPASLHLIGQSEGCIVVTSAARALQDRLGCGPSCLTLIDPAFGQHKILFENLGAATAAGRVEHLWISSLSGFGRPAPYAGVQNTRLDRSTGVFGYLRPAHIDHYNAVRWHLDTLRR